MLDFSTITITNLGYQELTNNSLESLKKITNEIKPTIYCMDENSLENFKNLKYNTSLLEYKLSTSCEYETELGNSNYAKIGSYTYRIITE